MKSLTIILANLWLLSCQVNAQNHPMKELYIYLPMRDVQPAITPGNFLQLISKYSTKEFYKVYALIETDMDSISITNVTGQTTYLRLKPGKIVYYWYDNTVSVWGEREGNTFWQTIDESPKIHYRHYSITKKKGVVKVE